MLELENTRDTTAMISHPNPEPETVCEITEEASIQTEDADVSPPVADVFVSTRTAPSEISNFNDPPGLDPDERRNLEEVDDDKEILVASAVAATEYDDEPLEEVELEDLPTDKDYEEIEAPPTPKEEPAVVVIVMDERVPPESAAVPQPNEKPKSQDKSCRFLCCGFPNGAWQILFAQFFLFSGLMLCSWAMADCKFIEATAGYPERYYPEPYPWWYYDPSTGYTSPPAPAPTTLLPAPDKRRGFGFVFNETEYGGCFTYSENRYFNEKEFTNYLDFLGSDWNIPRVLSGLALTLGWLLLCASIVQWCCSCGKSVRWLTGTIMILVIAGFQSSAFAVMGSSFCDDLDAHCEPARGFWMMLGGILCYLITGILFCCMRDYPGVVENQSRPQYKSV